MFITQEEIRMIEKKKKAIKMLEEEIYKNLKRGPRRSRASIRNWLKNAAEIDLRSRLPPLDMPPVLLQHYSSRSVF